MAQSATAMNDKQRMFNMVTFKNIALSCVAAATLAVSAPASAEAQSKPVFYHDLDLSSVKGQERLQIRIKNAVTEVCGAHAFGLAERADRARCQAEAIAAATSEVERTIARYQDSKRLAANERAAIVGN
jgi:UrcA family protein